MARSGCADACSPSRCWPRVVIPVVVNSINSNSTTNSLASARPEWILFPHLSSTTRRCPYDLASQSTCKYVQYTSLVSFPPQTDTLCLSGSEEVSKPMMT